MQNHVLVPNICCCYALKYWQFYFCTSQRENVILCWLVLINYSGKWGNLQLSWQGITEVNLMDLNLVEVDLIIFILDAIYKFIIIICKYWCNGEALLRCNVGKTFDMTTVAESSCFWILFAGNGFWSWEEINPIYWSCKI